MKLAESALLRTGATPGGVPSLSLVLISSSRTTIGTGQRCQPSASRAMTSSARSGGTTADSLARCAHAVMSYPPLDGGRPRTQLSHEREASVAFAVMLRWPPSR